jgi:uncharacterized membrane protein
MPFGLAFQLRQSSKGSLWLPPTIGVVVGVVAAYLVGALEAAFGGTSVITYSASTAASVLAAIIGATAALTGFVVTVVVLAVQMATGTFSARYMRLWYRNRLLKLLLAVLIGTLAFAFGAMDQVEETSVPSLAVSLAVIATLACLLLFVLFLDRFLHRLRPVAVAAYVAEEGERAFGAWQRLAQDPQVAFTVPDGLGSATDPTPALTVRAESAGTIQAVDLPGMATLARRFGCTIVVLRPIGDFVPAGTPIVEVFGERLPPIVGRRLASMVALGVERTIEQDPAFAVRIMVDVAARALSPAVNDPTTAVQVLDHLAEMLRRVGTAHLTSPSGSAGDAGSAERAGSAGSAGLVVVPLRSWEEFLELGLTEIREYGASSIQVVRRMRALLLELEGSVPEHFQPPVRVQLARLDATVARAFGGTEDADLAMQPDAQGIGGPRRR